MAKQKLKIGVLFGGKSAEHEVSLQSARNVINSLDKNKYEVIPIGIDKRGKWLLNTTSNFLIGVIYTFVDSFGQKGEYVKQLRAYGRAGEPCLTCKKPMIKGVIAQRGATWCPTCQAE